MWCIKWCGDVSSGVVCVLTCLRSHASFCCAVRWVSVGWVPLVQARVLLQAVKEVEESREVLAYTYVEGYFLSGRDAPELAIFNHLQTLLEEHTDHLQVCRPARSRASAGIGQRCVAAT